MQTRNKVFMFFLFLALSTTLLAGSASTGVEKAPTDANVVDAPSNAASIWFASKENPKKDTGLDKTGAAKNSASGWLTALENRIKAIESDNANAERRKTYSDMSGLKKLASDARTTFLEPIRAEINAATTSQQQLDILKKYCWSGTGTFGCSNQPIVFHLQDRLDLQIKMAQLRTQYDLVSAQTIDNSPLSEATRLSRAANLPLALKRLNEAQAYYDAVLAPLKPYPKEVTNKVISEHLLALIDAKNRIPTRVSASGADYLGAQALPKDDALRGVKLPIDFSEYRNVIQDAKEQILAPRDAELAAATTPEEKIAAYEKYCLNEGCANGKNFHLNTRLEMAYQGAVFNYYQNHPKAQDAPRSLEIGRIMLEHDRDLLAQLGEKTIRFSFDKQTGRILKPRWADVTAYATGVQNCVGNLCYKLAPKNRNDFDEKTAAKLKAMHATLTGYEKHLQQLFLENKLDIAQPAVRWDVFHSMVEGFGSGDNPAQIQQNLQKACLEQCTQASDGYDAKINYHFADNFQISLWQAMLRNPRLPQSGTTAYADVSAARQAVSAAGSNAYTPAQALDIQAKMEKANQTMAAAYQRARVTYFGDSSTWGAG